MGDSKDTDLALKWVLVGMVYTLTVQGMDKWTSAKHFNKPQLLQNFPLFQQKIELYVISRW